MGLNDFWLLLKLKSIHQARKFAIIEDFFKIVPEDTKLYIAYACDSIKMCKCEKNWEYIKMIAVIKI